MFDANAKCKPDIKNGSALEATGVEREL